MILLIKFQDKYDILRKLLKEVINRCKSEKSKIICATINLKNIKSKNVFKHIGMKILKENGMKLVMMI